jgi:hypothetical protein
LEFGIGIWDLGFGIWDLGFGIWDLGFGDLGFGMVAPWLREKALIGCPVQGI